MTSPATQRIAIATLIVLSGIAALRLWGIGQSVPGIDFYQFWAVGEAIEHDGVTNPYSDVERERVGSLFLERANAGGDATRFAAAAAARPVLETYSTPFLYTSIHWLATGDYETDFNRWRTLSLLAFVFGVLGFARAIALGWIPTLGLLAGLLLFFAALQSETQVQNVNSVQLGLLAAAVALLGRRDHSASLVGAGVLLAVSTMFKPNVGVVLVFVLASLLSSRRRLELALVSGGVAVGVAFALAASSAFFGSARCWLHWLETVRLIPPEIITMQMGNYAPLVFVFGEAASGISPLLILLLSAPVLAALWVRRADEARTDTAANLVGLGCVIFLLTANLVWEHYFILAVPLMLTTLGRGFGSPPQSAQDRLLHRTIPMLAIVGLLATPTFAISNLSHEVYFPLVQGAGAIVLYVLALLQLLETREEAAE